MGPLGEDHDGPVSHLNPQHSGPWESSDCVCYFPMAAVTNYHKPSWHKTNPHSSLEFWKLEIGNKAVSTLCSLRRTPTS